MEQTGKGASLHGLSVNNHHICVLLNYTPICICTVCVPIGEGPVIFLSKGLVLFQVTKVPCLVVIRCCMYLKQLINQLTKSSCCSYIANTCMYKSFLVY